MKRIDYVTKRSETDTEGAYSYRGGSAEVNISELQQLLLEQDCPSDYYLSDDTPYGESCDCDIDACVKCWNEPITFNDISISDIETFIKSSIDLNTLEKNVGIYETRSICTLLEDDGEKNKITIGITFEDSPDYDTPTPWYYYNIFCGEEYIDISGKRTVVINESLPTEKLPSEALVSIKTEIMKLTEGENYTIEIFPSKN